jgi:hypothetical protein
MIQNIYDLEPNQEKQFEYYVQFKCCNSKESAYKGSTWDGKLVV